MIPDYYNHRLFLKKGKTVKKWSLAKSVFKILFIPREGGREKEGTKHLSVASLMSPAGDLAHVCTDWELNQQPFGSQAGTQSTEPHQPGHESIYILIFGLRFVTLFYCIQSLSMLSALFNVYL